MEMHDAIKLLAIDDKKDNLTALSALVRDALPGTIVLTATSGPAGIELAAAEDPDVILLDIVMPNMDGFEVCRRLKADHRTRDIPVVFLTALKTGGASRVKALEAGAEGFLSKPLETAEMTAQIRVMTKIRAANRSRRTEKHRLKALVAERTHALRQSEAFIKAALDNLPVGVAVNSADPDVVFEYMNDNFPAFYRTSREALAIPDNFWNAVYEDPTFREEMKRRVLDDIATEESERMHWENVPITRKGEGTRYISARDVKVPGKPLLISTVWDITEQVFAEQERQKFFLLAESSSEFIGMCDLNMQPLYVNPAGRRMAGLPDMAAACRVKVQDYFFPEDQAFMANEFFPRVLREGHGDMEIRLRHFQTGEPLWLCYYLFTVLDACGTAVGWATVSRDITERKRTETLLKARAELADMASRGDLDDVLRFSLDKAELLTGSRMGFFHFVDANQQELTLQALSTNTLKNLGTADLQGRHYPINEAGAWADCCRMKKPVVHNNYASLPDKNGLPPELAPMEREAVVPVLHNGFVVCIMGVGNKPTDYTPDDVSHLQDFASIVGAHAIRLRAEQERNELLARFTGFAEASHFGMGIAELDGRIVDVNPALVRLLGEDSKNDCLGKNFATAYSSGVTADRFQTEVVPALQRRGSWHGELELLAVDGRRVPIEANAFVIRDEHNRSLSLGVILTDITERKQVKRQLAEAKEKAEAASAAKSQFLANMSHEIRTPMNGVIGMTGLLLDTELNSEQRHYAETIRSSGEVLLALVNDILDFSKIEAGKLKLELLDFDLRDLLENFAAPLAMRARSKGIEFDCAVESDVPSQVRGAPGRLRQILTNLAGNAVKFTEQGRVTVRASRITETATASVIRFTVRDTGVGIPPEHQENLFQKFTQVDASMTRRFGGTGLGLAISKQLAEMMGGQIGVNSKVGVGSEFWFTVPLGKPAQSKFLTQEGAKTAGFIGPPSDHLPAAYRRGARVLVAEDNVVNQDVALGILHKLGLRAEAVADGAEAVDVLKSLPYDLVLMDVQMPEMDGLEATRIIRDPKSPVLNHEVPIIAMTAHALHGDRRNCLQAGMNDYLPKPVSLRALVEALNTWLPKEAPKRRPDGPAGEVLVRESVPEAPVLDRGGLVARLMGDEELADRILNRFLGTTPQQIESLRKSLVSGDATAAKRTAHAIKGAASNIGGDQLQRVAFEIEQAARAGDLNAAGSCLAELQSQFERLKEAIQANG
jgi:PAS domain S-box-containing protein